MQLISLLSSPAPLTTQKIIDILDIPDTEERVEEELGFGATRFSVRKGNGYTSLSVEAFVFRGTIGSYRLERESPTEEWTRFRERRIELWQLSNGPDVLATPY
jgi:hypothetical protein